VRIVAGCVGVAMFLASGFLATHPVTEVAMIGLGLALCGLAIALSAILRPRNDEGAPQG